jgi:hypothetical protein
MEVTAGAGGKELPHRLGLEVHPDNRRTTKKILKFFILSIVL